MTPEEIKKKFKITGCEHCPYFVEVQDPWRQYCGRGNFNINRASFEIQKTSHGKNKQVTQERFEWEFDIPKRCPLLKEKMEEENDD